LEGVGIDPTLIDGDEIKNQLRANTYEVVSRDAFVAPTFFVNRQIFSGNDRLDILSRMRGIDRREI
jgi:2-hydroxychromene-2-carboxylate isomerase